MIQQELLSFLQSLSLNNNKDWFETHKTQFKTLDKHFKGQMNQIASQLDGSDSIEKTKVFRIYRDVRFSHDKTPFKNHRSVNWLRSGASRRGSYYMRIMPGASMLGIGFFAPEKEDLFRIRKELEQDAQELRSIIKAPIFLKTWGILQGEPLKLAPKNFDKTHPDIDLIRFKSFFFTKTFSNKEVMSSDFEGQVLDAFSIARPFLDYMSSVLTTNLNGESLI
jgi:uncharacterized protein (TIGR02453 family)